MRSSIYNIIDFENSRKRECESDYFNSKFFEMFPTKYEKLLREYEVILFYFFLIKLIKVFILQMIWYFSHLNW